MRMILPTLPVKDVRASRAFFAALGFGFGEPHGARDRACVIVDGGIRVMLVEERRFRAFIAGEEQPRGVPEGLLCLSCDTREQVRDLGARACAAGASAWKAPQDLGVLYGESFRDLDGHVWELLWMGVVAQAPASSAVAA